MNMFRKVKRKIKKYVKKSPEKEIYDNFYKKYSKYSFIDGNCKMEKQYEASITRLYHTLEKGLAYLNYRPGFGKDNVNVLLSTLEEYSKKYDIHSFFYETALCVLNEYIRKNKEYGMEDKDLNKRVAKLPGNPNNVGGIIHFQPLSQEELKKADFQTLVEARHSIRHFSNKPIELNRIIDAVKLAQYTPSACNRQGWKTYIIEDKKKTVEVLKNQNGNRGFGQEFDKLLVVTGDLRCFNHDREVFQVFIDSGMYAMRLLDSLFYKGIASVPLSASLSKVQEDCVRSILNLNQAEVLIMFIGIGNYPEKCQTTRSERKPAEFTVI